MFGWFKKNTSLSQNSQDLNGRAIRPDIPGLLAAEDASTAQINSALAWALEWTGSKEIPVPHSDLHLLVSDALTGKMPQNNHPASRVVSAAVRCLRLAAQDNKSVRSQAAFPWIQFRLGPQERPCRLAASLEGQILPFNERPRLPLLGCNSDDCACWVRQVSKSEAVKRRIKTE